MVLDVFQGLKIPGQKPLVRVAGPHNGHDPVDHLVRDKQHLFVRIIQPKLSVSVAGELHRLKPVIPIAERIPRRCRGVVETRNIELPALLPLGPPVDLHEHLPDLGRVLRGHTHAAQNLRLILRSPVAVAVIQAVVTVPVLQTVQKQPGSPLRVYAGQPAVVVVLVGQKNVQLVVTDPQLLKHSLHDPQAVLVAEARVHHQAPSAFRSLDNKYFNLADAQLPAVQLHLENSRCALNHVLTSS